MPQPVYSKLDFPAAPPDRPYLFINMVATIDGRTTAGGRDRGVSKIGSDTDHATMHYIEEHADAMMIGAGNLRANPIINVPNALKRYVVTASGQVNPNHCFLARGTGTWLVMPAFDSENAPEGMEVLASGAGEIDWTEVLRTMRLEHGVERLLVEGGAKLNADLLLLDLVDEMFLTLAPKIRLGTDEASFADGPGLPNGEMNSFDLLSCLEHESELFLRYRRHR